MNSSLVFCFCLLALIASANASGEVILDSITAIGDKVTFEDPLFTNFGVVESIETDSFSVTRQFELNVHVPDVFLTSLTGDTHFSGSQGATVSSLTGDVVFHAQDQVLLAASEITGIARNGVLIESETGSIEMNAFFPLSMIGGATTIDGTESLSVFTTGELAFHAGEHFSVDSDGTVAFSSNELFSLEARNGNIAIGAANELVMSATEFFRFDGTHGVSISTLDTLGLIAGRSVILTSVTSDTLIRGDANISFTRVNLVGNDGVVVGGHLVDLNASGRLIVESDSPGAVISADYGTQLNITAANDVVFRTTGETGDVEIHSTDLIASIADEFSVDAKSFFMGSNSTDSFRILTNTYEFDSNYMGIHSDATLDVTSQSTTTLNANDIVMHTGVHSLTATGSFATFTAGDWNVFNPLGDVNGHAMFSSNSDLSMSAISTFNMQGAQVAGDFGSQQYNIQDLSISSSADEDISFTAGSSLTGSVGDDFSIDTSMFNIIGGNSLTLNVLDFSMNAVDVTMFVTNVIMETIEDVDFDSSNHFRYEGSVSTFFSVDEHVLDVSGTITVAADDVFFEAGDDVEIEASKTVHINIKEDADLEGGDMIIQADANLYMKTSEFTMESGAALIIDTNSLVGSFGNLALSAGDSVEFTGDNLFEILSGGFVDFNVVGDITVSVGDDIDITVQENLTMNADSNISFTSTSFDIVGSQEFEFHADGAMTNNALDTLVYLSDIFEQTSASLTVSSDTIEVSGGTTHVSSTDGNVVLDGSSDIDFLADVSLTVDARVYAVDAKSFQSSSDLTNFNAGSMEFESTTSDLSILTQQLNLNGWNDVLEASTSADITGSTSVSMSTSADQGVALTSASTLDITSGSLLTFYSDTDSSIWAETFIDLNAVGTMEVSSVVSTSVHTDTTFFAFASNKILIGSAEDASVITEGANDITVSSLVDASYEVGRDFQILANGLEGTCGIAINTVGGAEFLMESIIGSISLDSYKDTLLSSSSFVEMDVSGNIFMESYESGLMYLAEGNSGGIAIETSLPSTGNIEFLADTAEFQLYATFEGFTFSSDTSRFAAETGIEISAVESEIGVPTVLFSTTDDFHLTGARGVAFRAGLDAPVFDSSIIVSSNAINLESLDLIHMQSIGTFTSDFGATTKFEVFEGNSVSFSAAKDLIVLSGDDIRYVTTDGDQTFTANDSDFTMIAGTEVSIETNEGPINMHALAGAFTMTGTDWVVTSNMDTRALSLGQISLDTANDFRLIADETILIQNERPADLVHFSGDQITANSDHDGFSLVRDIEMHGNNVDFIASISTTFESTASGMNFGKDSNPIVTIIAGGDAGVPGLVFTSVGDISTSSVADITTTSLSHSFDLRDTARVNSFGLISMISEGGDLNFGAEFGSVKFASFATDMSITGDHSIIATAFGLSQSRLVKEVPIHADDLITINAASDILITADLYQLTAGETYTLDVVDDAIITATNGIYFTHDPLFTPSSDVDITEEPSTSSFEMNNVNSIAQITGIQTHFENALTKISAGDTLSIEGETMVAELLSLGAILNYNSQQTFTASAVTEFSLETFPVQDASSHVEEETDMYFEGTLVDYAATTSLSMTANGVVSMDIEGSTDLNVSGNLEITTTTGIENIDTQFQLSSGGETLLSAGGSFTLFNVNPPNNIELLRDEYSILIDADAQLLMDSGVDFLLQGNQVLGTAAAFTFDLDQTLFTSNRIFLTSTGFESDIGITSDADMAFTSDRASLEALGQLQFDFSTSTIQADSFQAEATFGDIFVTTPIIAVDSIADMTFTANGHQSDDNRAIAFISGDVSFDGAADVLVQVKDRVKFDSDLGIVIDAPLGYSFQSTGYNSPITVTAIGNAWNLATTASLNINGGQSASVTTDTIILNATNNLLIQTEFDGSGILFDTDTETNALAAISFSAPGGDMGIGATVGNILFETDFDGATSGSILLSSSVSSIFTSTDITISSEQADIIFSSDGTLTSSVTTPVMMSFDGDNVVIDTLSLAITSPTFTFYSEGDIRGVNGMTGTVISAPLITLDTHTTSRDNHIVFAAPSITVNTVDFFASGNGGNGGILIDSDFSTTSSFTAINLSGPIDWHTDSGIIITGTQHENPDASPISVNAADNLVIRTDDKKGIVFFQSDHDTIIQADTRIIHDHYQTRMGFFSQVPDFVHLANQQSTEICLRQGWCGFTSSRDSRSGHGTGAISLLSSVSVQLQSCLLQFGLLSWQHPLV